MLRRSFWALSLGALLVAAACSGGNAPVAATSTPAPATATPATPIKIGVLDPLTGTLANVGKDNSDGFKLYLQSINNTIAGRPIEVIVADTQGAADVAAAKARDLVENQKVDILAGISQTPECYAVAQYVQKAKIPTAITGNCGATYLTVDPQYASPYIARFTSTNLTITPAIGAWLAKRFSKAVLFTTDFAGGLELGDIVAASFLKGGGTIVQELHPPMNTADFGPYLTQLRSDADVAIVFLPGADGIRFGQQYSNYVGGSKIKIFDMLGQVASPEKVANLKDLAVGILGGDVFSDAIDSPQVTSFVKSFSAAYNRPASRDAAVGYAGAQVVTEALKKTNGIVSDTDAFMKALWSVSVATPRGTIKTDDFHDIVHSVYLFEVVKTATGYGQKLLDTVDNASQLSYFTIAQIKAAQFGKLKGKWVGMTKDGVDKLLAP